MATTLVSRMKLLLSSANGADVRFLVGQGKETELLHAHKLVLMTASDVFEAMFRFDSKNGGKGGKNAAEGGPSVVVPDVKAAAFKVMLSFIYAEDTSGLNGDNAMAVLYAAKKYAISLLVNACVAFPIAQLRNVFFAYEEARLLDENDFVRRCLDHIDQNAEVLFHYDAFLQIDQKLLCEIIGRDQLRISGELAIWDAALRWADAKCRQNGTECSAENRRAALGPALFKIRFPLIPQGKFAEEIVLSGILTHCEVIGVFLHHSLPNRPAKSAAQLFPLQFPTNRRSGQNYYNYAYYNDY